MRAGEAVALLTVNSGQPRKPKAPGKYKRKPGTKPRMPKYEPDMRESPDEGIGAVYSCVASALTIADVEEQVVDGVQRVYRSKRRSVPNDAPTPTPPPVA